MFNKKALQTIFAGLSLTMIVNAADPQSIQKNTDPKAMLLEKVNPEIRGLGQSIAVFQDHLKIPKTKIFDSKKELSYETTIDYLNIILALALDYFFDPSKTSQLKVMHSVTGKLIADNHNDSAYKALIQMLEMIHGIQNKLAKEFGEDQQDESVRLRHQLDGALRFDTLTQTQQPSFSQTELLAFSFLQGKEASRKNKMESDDASSSSSENSSRSSTPTPKTTQSEPTSPYSSIKPNRIRANSSTPQLYVPPSALGSSPLFKKRANSTATQEKPE